MKKFIAGFLFGLIATSIPATFALSYAFPDVLENKWYSTAIANLHRQGIVEGHPDGTFGVGENIKREEMAVIIDRLFKEFDEKIAAMVTWKPYVNEKFGFTIQVPEKVQSYDGKETVWLPLNIYEEENSVYFSSYTSEETLQKNLWEFRVGGTTVKSQDEILPFLESYYGVGGCGTELRKDEDTGYDRILITSKNEGLMMDDPMACIIGGKSRTLYDEVSGKLITYNVADAFFASQTDKFLGSLKFTP